MSYAEDLQEIVDAVREARDSLRLQMELAGMELRDELDELEELADAAVRQARRAFLFLAGTTVVFIGFLLILTPFPGSLVIMTGLGILAVEFAWARRWRLRLERAALEALEDIRLRLEE